MTRIHEVARAAAVAFALASFAAGCGSSSSGPEPTPPPPPSDCTTSSSTTQLKVTNATAQTVPVQITLGRRHTGSGSDGTDSYGITNISQLPAAWTTYPEVSASTIEATFLLGAGQSTCFNSGNLSFSGNIAFGPVIAPRGCGGAATSCYPDAATFFEFALNLGPTGWETVDISGVNGTNALVTANLGAPIWTNSVTTNSVTSITNTAIGSWTSGLNGVYGWQSTNCTSAVNPPNPLPTCAAPLHTPAATQNQSQAICNIQRSPGTTGGTVEVVFNGYASGSAPGAGCVGGYTSFLPANGSTQGGAQVTMTGYGLDRVTAVTFQGIPATIVGTPTATSITVTTPAYPYCAAGATSSNAGVFFTVTGVGQVPAGGAGANYTYRCP